MLSELTDSKPPWRRFGLGRVPAYVWANPIRAGPRVSRSGRLRAWCRRAGFGGHPPGRQDQRPGGDHERAARAGEGVSGHLDDLTVGAGGVQVRIAVPEGQVEHPSDEAAAACKAPGSASDARMTAAPSAASRSADATKRARPVISWPALASSATTADPTSSAIIPRPG